jgi:predicted RNase H-like HicB family nuclease
MKITIKLAPNDQGRWRAWCPSLPGCLAIGDTAQQAQAAISEAIVGYLASLERCTSELELLVA